MSGNKIGMEMGFKNILDCCVIFGGFINIRLYFAKRIKNGCLAIALQIIGGVSNTSGINLFYFHNCIFYFV